MKSGFGWSDEMLYDAFLFDLQVRYALGLRDFTGGNFDLRTLYNFRHRLSAHMQETGENLLERVFVQVTDEQLVAYKLQTHEQRMDATFVASNIRYMSRLYLLVEVLHRVWRMLNAVDQERLHGLFAPYVEQRTGQFCHRLTPDQAPAKIQAVGELMLGLKAELTAYRNDPSYQLLLRVFGEHFEMVPATDSDEATVQTIPAKEIIPASLQAPDDLEATYRTTTQGHHVGYKANAAETCAPENPFQLVTSIQVAPNLADDQDLMAAALPELIERTGLSKLWTDGGFTGEKADRTIAQHKIEQVPTALRGEAGAEDKLAWQDFAWQLDAAHEPVAVTCPGGQSVAVMGRERPYRSCVFDQATCRQCPLQARCKGTVSCHDTKRTMWLPLRTIHNALRRQRTRTVQGPGRNRRAAVEALMRCLKHPFGGQRGKLPVRGLIRVSLVMAAAALMINVRRIWRHGSSPPEARDGAPEQPEVSTTGGENPHDAQLYTLFAGLLNHLGLRLTDVPSPNLAWN
jgi:Transposase DDE domain